MATGLTKNKWQETVQIIPSEQFSFETDYKITYEGKASEEEIINTPFSKKYDSLSGELNDNKLFYGDNLDVLRFLLQTGYLKSKVKLVYIDPPYGTNSVFQSRNQRDSYKDDLVGSHFIEFIRRRLIILREILCDEGSIYVHLDSNMKFTVQKTSVVLSHEKNAVTRIPQKILLEISPITFYFTPKPIILLGKDQLLLGLKKK